jgi:hypothetical protein
VLKEIDDMQQNGKRGGYLKGTSMAREYFWSNGMKKGVQNDCQTIFHRLTDADPLKKTFSCAKEDGQQTKAFEVIRSGEARSLNELFAGQKHNKLATIISPEFITFNDLITAQIIDLQYIYPTTFSAYGYVYVICARVMATSQKGGHFYTFIKDEETVYKADNMNGYAKKTGMDKLYGKAKILYMYSTKNQACLRRHHPVSFLLFLVPLR